MGNIVDIVKKNGKSIVAIVGGVGAIALGVLGALKSDDDCGKYEPGEIAASMSDDETEEDSGEDSEE